jgi:hypothetical protein
MLALVAIPSECIYLMNLSNLDRAILLDLTYSFTIANCVSNRLTKGGLTVTD